MRSVIRGLSLMMKPARRPQTHVKARCETYPRNPDIKRFKIPDDKVTWDIQLEGYEPVDYTAPSVASKPVWADPEYKHDPNALTDTPVRWNELDGKIDRRSHTGPYAVIENLPRNPVGRSGVCSRGLLGRWGPNHAADPIVTRWKRNSKNEVLKHDKTKKPLLEFIAIQRKDSGEWAIPGGMVDAGENVSTTLKREFSEEAMNFLEASKEDRKQIRENVRKLFCAGEEGMVSPGEAISETLKREFSEEAMNTLEVTSSQQLTHIKKQVRELFRGGTQVYRGYVDDPRNTDNAWMETVAVNFHDESGQSVGRFKLHAGDDAVGVKWHDLHSSIQLYASHVEFCETVAKKHKAHW